MLMITIDFTLCSGDEDRASKVLGAQLRAERSLQWRPRAGALRPESIVGAAGRGFAGFAQDMRGMREKEG